jgi:hypothetical protein
MSRAKWRQSICKDRLRAVRGGLPLTPAKGYFNAIFADQLERVRGVPDLSTPEGQAWLAPQIGDAEVIVVDSITTLMPTQDQNEGHDWASTEVWLLDLRRRGISVIMIHHNNKSGAQNGTERRMVPLDPAIDLSRPPGYRASEGAVYRRTHQEPRLLGRRCRTVRIDLPDRCRGGPVGARPGQIGGSDETRRAQDADRGARR